MTAATTSIADPLRAACSRGGGLHGAGRFEEAVAAFDAALAIDPHCVEAHLGRGQALRQMGRYEEAVGSYERVLAVSPDLPAALNNRALALEDLQRFEEALESFDQGLRIAPENAEIRFNRGYLLLLLGRFAEGWPDYEWRRQRAGADNKAWARPEWRGEAVAGKRVLLHCEQGLGDTLQFARFARTLEERGAEVIVAVQGRLGELLGRLDRAATIVRPGEALPEFDLQLPLMSVPHALGFNPLETPAQVPYLVADPALIERWSNRLPAAGFRVGIAWHGNPAAPDSGKHIPLAAFAPLAGIRGVKLISLQRDAGAEQSFALPGGVAVQTLGADFDAGPDGFLDTAAVMMNLDLIVTTDTAVAHLAGALARPVWIALRHVPDWRWLLERADSPWYPTARLFRQRRPGDWGELFARIAAALAQVVEEARLAAARRLLQL